MKTALLIVAFAFVTLVIIMWRSTAPAAAQTATDRAACAGDVARFCRSDTEQGAGAVLACLQKHREQISKSCSAVLVAHGK